MTEFKVFNIQWCENTAKKNQYSKIEYGKMVFVLAAEISVHGMNIFVQTLLSLDQ